MPVTAFLRLVRLEAAAAAMQVGWLPWIVGAGFALAALIQEPTFFRTQGLELAWPAIAGALDVIALVFVYQILIATSKSRSPAAATVFGTWLSSALVASSIIALATIYDAAGFPEATGFAPLWLLARFAGVWLPIHAFVAAEPIRRWPFLARFLAAVVGYLMQASVLPASLPALTLPLILTGGMGATFAVCLLLRGHHPS
jgi:hypothetical protein